MGNLKPIPHHTPPAGVPPALHREIMRRIRNRYHENHDVCSLRRGGPGLPELVGVLPLMAGLKAQPVKYYARQLELLRPLYSRCGLCSAKICGLIHLVLRAHDRSLAVPWLIRVLQTEADLAEQGIIRDFIPELLCVRIS